MPPPRTVTPLEALRLVTGKLKSSPPVVAEVEAAHGSFLAEAVDALPAGAAFPGDPPQERRASRDGYALAPGAGAGDELRVVPRDAGAAGVAQPAPRAGETYRVECGARLDASVHSLLPIAEATAIASDRIRVEWLPQPGDGIAGEWTQTPPRRHEPGTLLDGRLQAYLLASGRRRVCVHAPVRAGVLLIGDELTDLHALSAEGQVHDQNGYWLGRAVAGLGAEAVELGILPDDPAAFHRSLLGWRTRRIDLVILAGGLGDGLTDRTAEAVRESQGQVLFERLALAGCRSFLFAKVGDMDVLGLSGEPLACAAGFDLLARPALLARSGAGPRYWDWSRRRYPAPPLAPPSREPGAAGAWRLEAAEVGPPERGADPLAAGRVRTWSPESPFAPLAAGAGGWALAGPEEDGAGVYYVPVSLTLPGTGL